MSEQSSNNFTEPALLGISIPPCPTSLSSIMREAKRPSVDIKHLAKVIGRDAGIVGPLLKLANSPYIGLKNKVTSIFEAISVLGVQNTLNLVQNIALRQSVDGKSQNFEKFWERSSLEASIAEKIAAKFHGVSSDDAYLAALFHDCGIPILIMKFPGYRETVIAQCKLGKNISDVENDFFSLSHSVVGNMLTRNWMLPAHISKAILYHHDPTIFATQHESVGTNVLTLISILHMTECIVDDHLHVRDKEWPKFQHAVLKHLDMTEHEFSELKGDFLAVLNGE